MARSLDHVLAGLPATRRAKVEHRANELATLKDLREAVERTQKDLAVQLGVGQDTVSRIEQRSDILLSTLRRYVEAMGGELKLVARFPDREPFVIDRIGPKTQARPKRRALGQRSKSSPYRPSPKHSTTEVTDDRARNGRD